MRRLNFYSGYQFAFFRIFLGVYLMSHFIGLLPYSKEMFSHQGMIREVSLLPGYHIFPDLLFYIDNPLGVQSFVIVLAGLALLFSLGVFRPLVSLLLWYGWACLLNRNIFIANPGMPYLGFLLLACALVPLGEPLSWSRKSHREWYFPRLIFWGTWALMAVGYTLSGIHKLGSPSWLDGSALRHVLEGPLARDNALCSLLLSLPPSFLSAATFSTLLLEIAFVPLCLFSATRLWAWLLMMLMHLGILSVVNFADLTIGVMMVHFFTFDARWIKPITVLRTPLLFFDGICGLCDRFVDFVVQEDVRHVIHFSPLQGQTAEKQLPKELTRKMNSLVFVENQTLYLRSDAVIRMGRVMGGIWGFTVVFLCVPRKWRDAFYNFIANYRYQLGGKKAVCRLPKPHERALFID